MSPIPELKIRSFPLAEMALSVVTDGAIADPLQISTLHKSEFQRYPELSRQAPITGFEQGDIFNIPPAIRDTDAGVPPRYWLLSKSGNDLLQLQERFVSRNWRRLKSPLENAYYPGFDSVSASAFDDFDTLVRHAGGVDEAANPVGAQLLYDNIIVMRTRDGGELSLGDVLTNWNTVDPSRMTVGWQLQWGEPIPQNGEKFSVGEIWQPTVPLLHTQCMLGGIVDEASASTIPVLRLTMTVTSRVDTWAAAKEFFSFAHGKVREKFISLIKPQIREEWGAA